MLVCQQGLLCIENTSAAANISDAPCISLPVSCQVQENDYPCVLPLRDDRACSGRAGEPMITYDEWREKYVARDELGLYVYYNAQGHSQPKDAVTVSEASG